MNQQVNWFPTWIIPTDGGGIMHKRKSSSGLISHSAGFKTNSGGKERNTTGKTFCIKQLHALWTLDGLGATDKEILFQAMDDEDAQVRKAAIWMSETFLKNGDQQIVDKLEKLKDDESYDVRTQLLLTLYNVKMDKAKTLVQEIIAKNPKNEMLAAVQNTMEKNEAIKTVGKKYGRLDVAEERE